MPRAKFIVGVLAVLPTLLTPWPVAQAAAKYKVLHSFNDDKDGYSPGALTLGSGGRLYGAGAGPPFTYGLVFELAPGAKGWTLSTLYSFLDWKRDGEGPNTPLIFDNAGALYGTTSVGGGGYSEAGVVFKLSPDGVGPWSEDVLYVFCSRNNCDDGGAPSAGVVRDRDGNLYGTTYGGGTGGVVFELSSGVNGWTESVLYGFHPISHDGTDGYGPLAGLTWDASGNLYGTTSVGGNYSTCSGSGGCGVVFELTPTSGGGWQEHILHRFAAFPHDGGVPYTGVVLDSSGNVYGVTAGGGIDGQICEGGCGTAFKLSKTRSGQWKETILHDFDFTHGAGPLGTLVFDKAGSLYGTAWTGGSGQCGCGLVFKLSPGKSGKWTYSVVHEFTGPDGANPAAGVILDSQGNLYGTTQSGGAYGGGVIFEITP